MIVPQKQEFCRGAASGASLCLPQGDTTKLLGGIAVEAAKHNLDLTEGVIWKSSCSFSSPSPSGPCFSSFTAPWTPSSWASLWGRTPWPRWGAPAAVIVQLVVGIFTGLSSGATVVISHGYGAGDKEKLHHAVHSAVAFSLLAGAIITVVGILLTPTPCAGPRIPRRSWGDATLYLRLYFLGTIPTPSCSTWGQASSGRWGTPSGPCTTWWCAA